MSLDSIAIPAAIIFGTALFLVSVIRVLAAVRLAQSTLLWAQRCDPRETRYLDVTVRGRDYSIDLSEIGREGPAKIKMAVAAIRDAQRAP